MAPPLVTQRRGRGFPGLLSNALQPLSKAQQSAAPAKASSTNPWKTRNRLSKAKQQAPPASRERENSDASSSGSSAAQAAGSPRGTIELAVLDGVGLPVSERDQVYWLVDFDAEFAKTACATFIDGKPHWGTTSTHDVTSDLGKLMLYLYRLDHGDKILLGTALLKLQDRLQDGKTETHWISFNSKGSDECATASVRVVSTYRRPTSSRIGPQDFKILKVLGKGSFGTVYQVRKVDSGRAYAMKVLSKEAIAKRRMSGHVLSERKILEQFTHLAASSPFLVCLKFSFQTKNDLYLVMDLKRGGELFQHLQREGGRLDEERVRFYAAEIVLALQTLHENGVVYRDLKPENILLDEAGHICLVDFGLSKLLGNKQKTKTFCGTAEYLPPEMIESDSGYDVLVDWWSLGCLIFELICGFTPFFSEDNMDKYKRIMSVDLKIPKRGFSPVVTDLINRLLCKEPNKRLGAKGAQEIKTHPFFENIDWKALAEHRVEPPFKPDVPDDPLQELEFTEEGPPSALLPFLSNSQHVIQGATSSEDREQQPQYSGRSSCQVNSPKDQEEIGDKDDHWWRDFTFANAPSSRASLTSLKPNSAGAEEKTFQQPTLSNRDRARLSQTADEPVRQGAPTPA